MSTQKNTFRHISGELKTLIMQNRDGQKVIERILSAYGFTSRQAFCNHLGISQSTMANRYARDTFPADWVVICSVETGVSVEWLAFGSDSINTKMQPVDSREERGNTSALESEVTSHPKNPIEIKINPNQGGKAAIERLVEAYGFKTRQALADHLKVSKSTLANRYMRDTFPADWIIQCALETGVSLKWLTTGQADIKSSQKETTTELPKQVLTNGELLNDGSYIFDKYFLPKKLVSPCVVVEGNVEFICDRDFSDIRDGKWIVSIDGVVLVRTLTRLPNARTIVEGGNSTFECSLTDIKILAKVIVTCTR